MKAFDFSVPTMGSVDVSDNLDPDPILLKIGGLSRFNLN